MSAKIVGQVWDLQLPHAEIFVLLAMADHAEHDGSHVFPSQALIAWKTGYSVRQVRRIQNGLKERKILIQTGSGWHGTNHYRIDLSLVPRKKEWVRPDKMSSEDTTSPHTKSNVNKSLHNTEDKMSAEIETTKDKMSADKMSSEDIWMSDESLEALEAKDKDTPLTPQQGEPASQVLPKPTRRSKLPREQSTHDPEGFERFYQPYPKHMSKQDAMNVWDTLRAPPELRDRIIANVEKRAWADPEWLKEGGKFVPNPATYLRNGRWTDEWKPVQARITKFVE